MAREVVYSCDHCNRTLISDAYMRKNDDLMFCSIECAARECLDLRKYTLDELEKRGAEL